MGRNNTELFVSTYMEGVGSQFSMAQWRKLWDNDRTIHRGQWFEIWQKDKA